MPPKMPITKNEMVEAIDFAEVLELFPEIFPKQKPSKRYVSVEEQERETWQARTTSQIEWFRRVAVAVHSAQAFKDIRRHFDRRGKALPGISIGSSLIGGSIRLGN